MSDMKNPQVTHTVRTSFSNGASGGDQSITTQEISSSADDSNATSPMPDSIDPSGDNILGGGIGVNASEANNVVAVAAAENPNIPYTAPGNTPEKTPLGTDGTHSAGQVAQPLDIGQQEGFGL